MQLRQYFRIAVERWRVVVLCLAAALGLAAALTLMTTPKYASSARVFLSAAQVDSAQAYQGSLFSAQRVTSYADLAKGPKVASRVIQRTGIELSVDTLMAKVSAVVVPETVMLQITVTDESPARAQRLTQATAEVLRDFVTELETPVRASEAPIKATIVADAPLPIRPVEPQPVRNIGVATVLGLLVGLGAALARHRLDDSVRTISDVEAAAGAPILVNIQYDAPAALKAESGDFDADPAWSEAFRVLRTGLQFTSVDNPATVVVTTSSLPREGKTTVSINLALALAHSAKRVLLIDGDLRRPRVAESLGLGDRGGLTNVLAGDLAFSDALQRLPSGLMVLTSGPLPPNPAELIESEAMAKLLAEARLEFDMVLIDAPPVLPVTDASLLARMSDGTVLVVRHGGPTRAELFHTRQRLESVEARILGAAFNMVPSQGRETTPYGYGYSGENRETSARQGGLRRKSRRGRRSFQVG